MLVAQLSRSCPPLLSRSTGVHTLTWTLARTLLKITTFHCFHIDILTGCSPTMLRSRRCHGERGDGRETQEALTSQGHIWRAERAHACCG